MPEDASPMALGTLALAVLGVLAFWRWTGSIMSIVQFTTAKITAVITGVRKYTIAFVRKDARTSLAGYAVFTEGWWPSKVTVAFVSVPAPSVVGLILARGVEVGWNPRVVLAVLLLLLIVPFVYHANWQSLLFVGAVAAALAVLIYLAGFEAQLGATILLSWILLIGGFRWVIEHAARPDYIDNTAVDALEDLTAVHADVWTLFFLFTSLAALVAGARWLLF
jgi:hypothetical protein